MTVDKQSYKYICLPIVTYKSLLIQVLFVHFTKNSKYDSKFILKKK